MSRLRKNIRWIFFGNVLHSALNFLVNIYVARKLSLNDNGIVSYSASLITLLTAVASLGYSGVITRKFSEHKDKIGEYVCSCVVSYAILGVVAMGILQVIVRALNPGEPQLYLITLYQSTTIVTGATGLFVYWYRFENKANVAAILRLVAFGLSALWRIVALNQIDGLVWYVCGTAAETAIFGGLLIVFYFKKRGSGKFRYSIRIAVDVLKESYPFIFAAILSAIYAQSDKIMLKSMMSASAVALYTASATLAGALSMIPTSLIEAFRPDIMECKISNENLYQKRMRQLYSVVFWSSMAYCLFTTVFAKQIILVIYGTKYIEAKSSLALIVWYSAFSYFGSINNMYMVAEKKAKWVQVNTFVGTICNVTLNYLMIPALGIVGAALASFLTQFVANFAMMYVVKDLRAGFFNMLKGIAFIDTDIPELTRRVIAKVKHK